MPHCERWAEKLLRDLPNDPEDLLVPGQPGRTRNYADPGFLKRFYEWLGQRIYDDPQAALPWARVAPKLALLVPEGRDPETHQAHREDVVMGHALLGGAYRAVSRHDDAEEQYRIALGIVELNPISSEFRVDLLRRLAYLRIFQGRPEEAMDLLELDGLEGLERLRTLLCRGHALAKMRLFSEAMGHLGEVLEGIDPSESPSAERTRDSAACIMAHVIQEGDPGPKTCWIVLGYIAKAKKLTPHRPSLPLYQLQWIEGLTWAKLWRYETPTGFSLVLEAEQALKRALGGFLHLRVPWHIALVSLDLAQLYRDLARWDELLKLALETLQRFQILSGDTQAVAALGLIIDAVRAKGDVETVIAAARETLRRRQQGGRQQPPSRVSVEPMASPPPAGRSNLALVETRAKLLEAAHAEIQNGFRLSAIIERAGVNRDTFYKQFGNREGCAAAVVDEHMHSRVMDWLKSIDVADPLGSIAALAGGAPRLEALPNAMAADQLEKLLTVWRRGLAEKLSQGQQEGTVRADVDPEETAAYLIAGLRTRDLLCLHGALRYLEMLKPG